MSFLRNQDMRFDESSSKNYVYDMQKERYETFKSQDHEKGSFDVTFEVEGKKIYAHSFMLTSVSDYMKVMLSDRWSKKDERVKIESYSYDNFYEFLCFIYSGHCKINKSNAFELIDMSEFYGVLSFKKFCDKALSSMEKTVGEIEDMFEIAVKYSLPDLKNSIRIRVKCLRDSLYNDETFLNFKKPFVEFLSTIDRNPDCPSQYIYSHYKKESEFFEAVYKWAENRVMKQRDVADQDFNLLESIKAELADILPNIKFAEMSFEFLMDFVLEKGFFLSSTELKQFFINFRNWKDYEARKYVSFSEYFGDESFEDESSANEDTCLKTVYELAKKQAMKKEEMTPEDQDFNFVESIRSDLIEVIPLVKFHKLDKTFLKVFVVANGILSKEQANDVHDTRVQVKNNGKSVYGSFKDTLGIRNSIESQQPCIMKRRTKTTIRFLKLKFPVPKGRSTLKKMVGVEWYLCLDKDGILSFKNHNSVKFNDYLLAEMKPKTEFNLTPDEETCIKAYYNNVLDL